MRLPARPWFWKRPANAGRSPKKKSRRKRLYDLHAWVGFHLAVIMCLVLFTGTFATISQELDWLANPGMRVTPDGDQVSMQTMIEAVRTSHPADTIMAISAGEGDHFAYEVQVYQANGVIKNVLVDQWSGRVTGEASFFDIKYFFRQLHRYLFLPSVIGLTIVSSMAIVLAISLYTGLKTSRNWRTLMTRIRFSKGARTAIGDAHKAAGLWSIWFFVLMISTGVWYYAEFVGNDFEPDYPGLSQERAAQIGDILQDPSAAQILTKAQAAYPDLQIRSIRYGAIQGASATVVAGTLGNPIVRERANGVFMDPISLDTIYVARDRDLGWVQWINQIVDPLHFGKFGGLPVKLIWFTFGLFMTGLSVSGVWLTSRRLKLRGASKMQLAVLPVLLLSAVAASLTYVATNLPFQSGIDLFAPGWFVIGLYLWGLASIAVWFLIKRIKRPQERRLSVVNAIYTICILAAIAGALHATILQNPFAPLSEYALGEQKSKPLAASLFLAHAPDGQYSGQMRMQIVGLDGRANIDNMTVHLMNGPQALGDDQGEAQHDFKLSLLEQPAYVQVPAQKLAQATHLKVDFEMNSKALISMTWSISQRD